MEYVALKDVCKINMGQSPDSSSYNDKKEGIPFYQGNADFGEKHPIPRVWCNAPTKIAQPKDILMSVRAPIGALNYAQEKCCIGRGLAAITPDKDKLSLEFLYWFLRGKNSELNSKGTGSTFKAISKKTLEEIRVPLIDLEKQQKMAQALEKTYSVIQMRTKQLKELDDLIKARFVEMFGDNQEVHKLSDIAAITGGLTKNSRRDKLELRKPYLRVANVFFASIDTTEILDIGLTKEEYEKTLLRNGDLLFVEGNGSPDQIGRVAIWNGEIEDCVHQNHLIKARFDLKRMNPVFAMYYFISERGRNQIKKRAVSTSGLYTLSVSKIADFEIPNPPMELQQQFAAFVAAIDKSKFLSLYIRKAAEPSTPAHTSLHSLVFTQHHGQLVHRRGDLHLDFPQVGENLLCRWIFHRNVLHFLVFVDGQVVVVLHDILFRHHEALLRPLPLHLPIQVMEPPDDIRNIVLLNRTPLVIQTEAIVLHVVEPDVIRSAGFGFGKNKDRRRYARVRFEYAGRHRDYGFQTVVLHDFLSDGLVCLRRTEQHPVRNDAGTSTADFQHAKEQCYEQKLRLLRLGDLQQIRRDDIVIQASLERRIRQDQ